MRAMGPKTYHMGRTLVFVRPDEYINSGKGSFLPENKLPAQNIVLQNNYTARYHSHARSTSI